MTMPDPREFAIAWIAAWNSQDVEAVLAHFHEDAVFHSPIARKLVHGVDGVVTGKDAIRRYWAAALERNPNLRFRLDAVHAGVDVLVIGFTTQDGVSRAEVLLFDEGGLIRQGYGTVEAGIHDDAVTDIPDGGAARR